MRDLLPYNGVTWLLANHRDLIDAEFCLNEGGWGESVDGKRIANDVQVSETYVINYRLEVTNKGGHSSLPVADNAISHLAGALAGLSTFGFPLKTNGVQGVFYDRDDIRFHGRDARVKVQAFYEAQTFLYELVKALSAGK